LPLVDPLLSRADALLGFDWTAVDAWVSSHAAVATIFSLTYGTILWQPFAIIFLVSVGRPGSTNSDLIWGMLLSVLLCSVFSALIPALGYEGAIGAAHIDALREIRAGAWTTLDIEKVEGIITFPSFHAALGVLFPYALRHIKWAFWPALLVNGTMILGTPVVGGHYLVDVIAGLAVAAFSILLLRSIRRRTARMRLDHGGSVMGALELALGRKR
jgi:membrane-associated phospholipid phosphatase